MLNLYMKQEMGRSYLVFPVDEESILEYQLKMMRDNSIEGLVNCKTGKDNDRSVLMYDVTNMKSLRKEYLSSSIEFLEIKTIFESIQSALNTGDKYLLDESGFVLDPAYIMRDMETQGIRYIYLPVSGTRLSQDMSNEGIFYQLADFLIERVNHKDDKSVSVAYQFYTMSKEETFSIRLFTNIIDKEDIVAGYDCEKEEISMDLPGEMSVNEEIYIDEEEEIRWRGVIVSGFGSVVVPAAYYGLGIDRLYLMYLMIFESIMVIILICLIIRNIYKLVQLRTNNVDVIPNKDISVEDYWGGNQETQFFDDRTTILGNSEPQSDVCFEWKEKGISKKYRATHFPIIIGKLINEVDCRIDDPSISRMHVKINRNGEKLSILDLNSTNGTSVDGIKINPGEEISIGMRSEIMLGQVLLRIT